MENLTLREKLEVVESLLKNTNEDYSSVLQENMRGSAMKSHTQYGKFNHSGSVGGGLINNS